MVHCNRYNWLYIYSLSSDSGGQYEESFLKLSCSPMEPVLAIKLEAKPTHSESRLRGPRYPTDSARMESRKLHTYTHVLVLSGVHLMEVNVTLDRGIRKFLTTNAISIGVYIIPGVMLFRSQCIGCQVALFLIDDRFNGLN